MSWFKGSYPSLSEMHLEIKRYRRVAHKVKKHRPLTLILLKGLRKKAHLLPYVDVWPQLNATLSAPKLGAIEGSEIKSAFRKYLLKIQGERCCYCRRWLVSTAYAKPIEHVLPRSHYPQFSVEFWNLAVACSDCNGIKSNNVWGSISTRTPTYPAPSLWKDTFHPRFHRYNDHIRYVRLETNISTVVLFTGLTPQGQHLCSNLLHKIAWKETLIENNQVLANAIKQIDKFKEKAESLNLQRFDAFNKALNKSVMRLLDQS